MATWSPNWIGIEGAGFLILKQKATVSLAPGGYSWVVLVGGWSKDSWALLYGVGFACQAQLKRCKFGHQKLDGFTLGNSREF